ncbi:hypothetical protein PHLGIDRAFT_442252 [Phlebiopsis gigantea 11061_1 CR5-6]|uniref:Uncharacterized protein n=1 Tax=Phlebiopsis gigantea (strain 11061_1 CR5-6) TaxID=745531 RepID=A0A0C3RY52_PHLG1|nr:hypothetical protein PHLGIDRAFT_442252 [Phlebiopsis gigantea 11061_1 CR5-6]
MIGHLLIGPRGSCGMAQQPSRRRYMESGVRSSAKTTVSSVQGDRLAMGAWRTYPCLFLIPPAGRHSACTTRSDCTNRSRVACTFAVGESAPAPSFSQVPPRPCDKLSEDAGLVCGSLFLVLDRVQAHGHIHTQATRTACSRVALSRVCRCSGLPLFLFIRVATIPPADIQVATVCMCSSLPSHNS